MTVRTLEYDVPLGRDETWQILREPADHSMDNPRQQAVHVIEGFETHALALVTAKAWVEQDEYLWGHEYTQSFLPDQVAAGECHTIAIKPRPLFIPMFASSFLTHPRNALRIASPTINVKHFTDTSRQS